MEKILGFSLGLSVPFLPLVLLFSLIIGEPCTTRTASAANPKYVGSRACRACHPRQYDSFVKYAKKARAFEGVERMRKGLTEDELRGCYRCHTTGYGRPGGFVSPAETPDMENAGCEVCHGPGEFHIRTGRAGDIKGHLTQKDCEICHIPERIAAFRYKPLIHWYSH